MSNPKVIDVHGVATMTDKTGAVTDKSEKLGLVVVEGPHAEVSVEMSFTKNLGNYQSARLQVGVKVPSNIDQPSMDTAFQYAQQWCDEKLQGMVKELEESLT